MDLATIIFTALNKTNKALFIDGYSVYESFSKKYPYIGNNLLIDSKRIKEQPYWHGYAVTKLGTTLESAYIDNCLNAPVDFVYIDTTSTQFLALSFLKDVIVKEYTSFVIKVTPSTVFTDSLFLRQLDYELYVDETTNESYLIYVH